MLFLYTFDKSASVTDIAKPLLLFTRRTHKCFLLHFFLKSVGGWPPLALPPITARNTRHEGRHWFIGRPGL